MPSKSKTAHKAAHKSSHKGSAHKAPAHKPAAHKAATMKSKPAPAKAAPAKTAPVKTAPVKAAAAKPVPVATKSALAAAAAKLGSVKQPVIAAKAAASPVAKIVAAAKGAMAALKPGAAKDAADKASEKVKAKAGEGGAEKEGSETPDAPLPLLDLSDAAVKKMIKGAKKRGYVTYEQLNAVMPSEEVTSEQIEDILAMLNEMGINVIEQEEAEQEEGEREEDDDDDSGDGELVEVAPKAVAKAEKSVPGERTDDPVRMYLREMGSVELLSREGEIAIAKRIEAGREAMIAGLCESPLTFQAIIIWRDELNDGKVFLRDIIDLEATYAGPDAVKGGPGI